MDLNATLLGQMITFAVFVWFTMKFVWPHIMKAIEDRRKVIADGLAAAERGQREVELAEHKVAEIIDHAKSQAAEIIDQANKRSNSIIEDGKQTARNEGERLIKLAHSEIDQERQQVKDSLLNEIAGLAITGAEKVLHQKLDEVNQRRLLDEIIDGV